MEEESSEMKRAVKMVLSALANVGMANGLYSIYHTTPPVAMPPYPDGLTAARIDGDAVRSAWLAVGADIAKAIDGMALREGR